MRAVGRPNKASGPYPLQTRFAHEPCHSLATHAQPVFLAKLSVNGWRAVAAFALAMDRMNARQKRNVRPPSRRHRPIPPGVKSTHRHSEQPAHLPYRKGGLVRLHESEERFGVAVLAFANQAAAFDRMSRSSFSCRFSRRSRSSSSRSASLTPPSPLPSLSSACLTQYLIVPAAGPNSRARCAGTRPARTSSTICCRNSGVYLAPLWAIADSSVGDTDESTKSGQAQNSPKQPSLRLFSHPPEQTGRFLSECELPLLD